MGFHPAIDNGFTISILLFCCRFIATGHVRAHIFHLTRKMVIELYYMFFFIEWIEKQFFERIINLTANETEYKVSLAELSKILGQL